MFLFKNNIEYFTSLPLKMFLYVFFQIILIMNFHIDFKKVVSFFRRGATSKISVRDY